VGVVAVDAVQVGEEGTGWVFEVVKVLEEFAAQNDEVERGVGGTQDVKEASKALAKEHGGGLVGSEGELSSVKLFEGVSGEDHVG